MIFFLEGVYQERGVSMPGYSSRRCCVRTVEFGRVGRVHACRSKANRPVTRLQLGRAPVMSLVSLLQVLFFFLWQLSVPRCYLHFIDSLVEPVARMQRPIQSSADKQQDDENDLQAILPQVDQSGCARVLIQEPETSWPQGQKIRQKFVGARQVKPVGGPENKKLLIAWRVTAVVSFSLPFCLSYTWGRSALHLCL